MERVRVERGSLQEDVSWYGKLAELILERGYKRAEMTFIGLRFL